MGWEATVLPNQKTQFYGICWRLIFGVFYDIFPKHREENHFRESDGSALTKIEFYIIHSNWLSDNLS
jgi:hypothetical protein